MSAWRVGSKTGVTLFKGEEIFGILLDAEKAAVVVSNLNLAAEKEKWPGARTPDWLLDEFLEAALAEKARRSAAEEGR